MAPLIMQDRWIGAGFEEQGQGNRHLSFFQIFFQVAVLFLLVRISIQFQGHNASDNCSDSDVILGRSRL
jgi:hypothetical protein